MESKILNLPDALRLARILSKYVKTVTLKGKTVEEFAYEIFGEMEVDEIITVSNLLNVDYFSLSPNELIINNVQVMLDNQVMDLLSNYEKIGFGK